MRSSLPLLLVGLLALAACARNADDPSPAPSVLPEGGIAGQVSIGPLCPVSPCPTPTFNPYDGMQAVLTAPGGETLRLSLRSDGSFSGFVPSGAYRLTLDPCLHLGCSWALPLSVEVTPNGMTEVPISIDTGIR